MSSRSVAYLKNAKTDTVVGACKQYGPIAFIGEGLTEMQAIESLSSAVVDLDRQLTMMTTFFSTKKSSDDSYLSVEYEVDDFNPHFRYVRIKKTITYSAVCQREPVVEYGPLMEREMAQAFTASLKFLS